jgi:urea transport system ATP-binding protein
MPDETLLSTKGLRAGYGGKPVLQGLDLDVHAGEIVAVIGRNGVGKSTLMKSLIGLIPTMEGSIVYRG